MKEMTGAAACSCVPLIDAEVIRKKKSKHFLNAVK